jgi:cytochrome c6
MKTAFLLVGLLLLFALPALAGGGADEGKEVFAKRCAVCHGKDGSGNGPAAKAFQGGMPDLSSKDVQALSDADIAKVINEGKGKMKPVKDLSKSDIANLTAFIRSLAKK